MTEVSPVIAERDVEFMRSALDLAARIPRRPWPNPPVGALVVRNGAVVGRGAHHGAGTPHAEAIALAEAGPLARGATLYCTLEPCNHQGRMPPCAPHVIASGITRVVAAMADPNPNVEGGGFRVLTRAGIETVNGVLGREALELVWPFVVTRAFERPFVVMKTATSLDGRFAPEAGAAMPGPFYLTGLEARRDVHRLRRWSDVVLVGGETARVDRPRLDTRLLSDDEPCPDELPLPAVASRALGADAGFEARPWVWFTSLDAARRHAPPPFARVVTCNTHRGLLDLRSLVWEFGRHIGHCLLVEAGPTLGAALLREGLVDRWVSYTAPVFIGGGPRWEPTNETRPRESRFCLSRVCRVGGDTKAVFDRVDFEVVLRRVTAPVTGSE